MATKNVNIDIIAKDKTRQAMQSATKGVNDLKTNVQKSVSVKTPGSLKKEILFS